MASHPPKQCCTIGVKHEGTPTGEFKDIGDSNHLLSKPRYANIDTDSTYLVDTYFAYPPDKSTTNAVLIFTDVLGPRFPNVQLIADQFAANGYFTVVPDLFQKDPIPANRDASFDMNAWRGKHGVEKVDPVVEATLKEMKEKYGVKRIGTVGYCFGAKSVVRYLKKGVTDAGYVAHPSFVTTEEVKAIEGPFSIAAAETDGIFPPEKRHETEQILKDIKVPYQINLYSGVVHGFAVRGDLSSKIVTYAKEQAFLQAIFWFDEHVKA